VRRSPACRHALGREDAAVGAVGVRVPSELDLLPTWASLTASGLARFPASHPPGHEAVYLIKRVRLGQKGDRRLPGKPLAVNETA
jgi:hypothetical protein